MSAKLVLCCLLERSRFPLPARRRRSRRRSTGRQRCSSTTCRPATHACVTSSSSTCSTSSTRPGRTCCSGTSPGQTSAPAPRSSRSASSRRNCWPRTSSSSPTPASAASSTCSCRSGTTSASAPSSPRSHCGGIWSTGPGRGEAQVTGKIRNEELKIQLKPSLEWNRWGGEMFPWAGFWFCDFSPEGPGCIGQS